MLVERYIRDYEEAEQRACAALLAEVRNARSQAAVATSDAEGGRGNFSAEVVEVLERAFAQQKTLNRAERRSLAEATGLEEKQVGTPRPHELTSNQQKFANQRQRRLRPSQRERTAPYDLTSRPKGRRDFSGSSASSLSSLNSALSDISTAPSSVESWISSSASSTISYDTETVPSSTREASPLPFGAQLPSFDEHADAPPAPHHQYIKPDGASSSIHPFFASPTTTSTNPRSNAFTFDPAPPPSPTTQLLSTTTAPFLQGFDFEQDPQDGAFWQQFLQGGFGAELGLGGGVSFAAEGGEGGEAQMSLMLPMPTPMEEEYQYGMDWGGVGQQ
uniref:Homeobox domain-containing protein n=1 Tax=Leucosporidium scottii TaxID=5278 RepID=A0A0H5FSC2_9BASI|nr:hypothetical protein [Leucosporidium scottii]